MRNGIQREKFDWNYFIRHIAIIAVPVALQNLLTTTGSMVDTMMLASLGEQTVGAVGLCAQFSSLMFAGYWGFVGGGMLFFAQYWGAKNDDGITRSFGITLSFMMAVGILFSFLALGAPEFIMSIYTDKPEIQKIGISYLRIVGFAYVLQVLSMAVSALLRSIEQVKIPLYGGMASVFANCLFNYLLIFGKFGLPALGAVGAAIATDIARVVECAVLICWTYRHRQEHPFIQGAFRSLKIPRDLTANIIQKGIPIMLNEIAWSTGQAFLLQCYSVRGLSVVAALNISSTVSNLFNVVFLSTGGAISIIVGQLLGAGKMEEAKDTDRKLLFFTVSTCLVFGSLLALISPFFPLIYNTSGEVQSLAARFILIAAGCMPLYAFMHGCYFTLRSGGKTWITVLFDSVYVWIADIPLAFILANFTALPIVLVYLSCQLIETLKCILGYVLVKKGIWLQNIVDTAS